MLLISTNPLDLALQSLGRLHPMLVHLPLGLLTALALLEAWAWVRGRERERRGAGGLVWLAAVGAALSAGAGLLLHEEGGYGEVVELHEVLGLASAGLALVTAILFTLGLKRAYRAMLFACVLILVPTGHFGASMTHGKGYLTEPLRRAWQQRGAPDDGPPADPDEASIVAAAPAATYASHVVPILRDHCYNCHGESKSKGKLVMHTAEGLLAGGFDGPILVPGDAAASRMLQRTSLPPEHEDRMPPEGKPQPSAEQLALLEAWIAAGASFDEAFEPPADAAGTDATEAPAADPAEIETGALTPLAPPGALAASARSVKSAKSAKSAESAAPELLAALDAERWSTWPLDAAGTRLALDAQAAADVSDSGLAALLPPLGPHCAELSLARTAAGPTSLAAAAALPNLERLDLTATPIASSDLAPLAGHPNLRTLVLCQTAVDDTAVEHLAAIPALERVYLFGSPITEAGLSALATAAPELQAHSTGPPLADLLELEPELE